MFMIRTAALLSAYCCKRCIDSCGRPNNTLDTPQKYPRPHPPNCEYVPLPGKKEFTDVMKLRILKWEGYLVLSRWDQGNPKDSYKWEAGGWESERDWNICWLWGWKAGSPAKECRWPRDAGTGQETDCPLELPERSQRCWHLDFILFFIFILLF